MTHTKGEVTIRGSEIYYIYINNRPMAKMHQTGSLSDGEQLVNSQHLGYCWNAFEEGGLVEKLVGAIKRAKDLYDELALSSLEAAAKYGDTYEPPTDEDWLDMREQLEQAIAEAKEGLK